MTDFNFSVTGWSQLGDFESSDASTVLRYAVLCKAKQFVVELEDSTGRTRAPFVVANNRTARMLSPGTSELGSEVEMKRVVLVRRGTCEYPPPLRIPKHRR